MAKQAEKDNRQVLLLASLLHDVGKLVQRASQNPSLKTHSEWGADWFASTKFSPELLPPSLKNQVESLIYNHHSMISALPELENLHQILQQADYLSAGERPEKEDPSADERGQWNREIPLRSILSKVHLKEKPAPTPSYWKLQPLTSSFIAPLSRESAVSSQSQYSEILDTLNSRLPNISSIPALLSLFEELFTFIPSETRQVLNDDGSVNTDKDPDISLFDHLKLSSAFALCLYDSTEAEKFLLVQGDISGVQKFIYTISSKGALKSLRARSLYIELLSNHIPALILEKLDLTPANLIFCGGAHFLLLLPNTSQAVEVLEEVKKKTNEWLWKNFRGRLYLALQWLPLSAEQVMGKEMAVKRAELSELIWREKLRKFSNLPELFKPEELKGVVSKGDNGRVVYECDVCQSSAQEFRRIDDIYMCPLCYSLFQLGGEIPKLVKPCFIAVPDGDIHLPDASYKLVDGSELSRYLPRCERIFLINGRAEEAVAHPHIYFLPLARYIKLDNEGNAYDFDKFAEEGLGAERIGVLRMDVDHLGRIFSYGLEENYSFSRVATLSRFLTIFFKNFMDDTLKGKNVAVVYSGGDDAFIVGSWSDVLESAFEIQERFSQFTHQNPSFTISAGFCVGHPKDPIYQLADSGSELEESAKNTGRDRFAMFFSKRREGFKEEFGKEPTWKECLKIKRWKEEIIGNYGSLENGHYELLLPRSLLYRLLDISREWQRGEVIYPYIYLVYILGRIKESLRRRGKDLVSRWEKLEGELLMRENIPHFVQLVYWIDLMVREKKRGGE